jgi:vancomycin resistance protein VanJ
LKLSRLRLLPFIQFIGRLTIAATWVLAVALVAWNLLRLYPGDRWLPVRLGNYFAPWLLMALVPALVVALLARRSWLLYAVLLLGLVFVGRYWPVLIPRLSLVRAGSSASELRLMTFNVNYANRNAPGIASLVRAESPDIIALQEVTDELAVLLQAELASEYPYFLFDNSTGLTLGLISRYPLTVQSMPPTTWRAQCATAEMPGGAVTVWNLHPPPAVLQRGWAAQRETLAAVARELEREAGPLVVLGDFNTTYQTDNYRLISSQLTEVHWGAGRGFGFTFPDTRRYVRELPPLRPMVRIDHVFVSEHFTPQETHVVPAGHGSDHRPVVATLRFANQ